MSITRLDYHTDITGAWDHLKGKGALAFDIGANIGQAAAVLAQGYKKVISFEPCIESYEILKREAPRNVECLNFAVSDHIGMVTLHEAFYSIITGQLVTHEGLGWGELTGSRDVPCYDLASLVDVYGMPDFIKIDTEGHEVAIVAGGIEVCSNVTHLVIEVHKQENEQTIRSLLPTRTMRKIVHPLFIDDFTRQNHFWLTS